VVTLEQLSHDEVQIQWAKLVSDVSEHADVVSDENINHCLLANYLTTVTDPAECPAVPPSTYPLLNESSAPHGRHERYYSLGSFLSNDGQDGHRGFAQYSPLALVDVDDLHDCEWDTCHQTFPSLAALCRHLQADHLGFMAAPFHCLWRSCDRHPLLSSGSASNKNAVAAVRPFPKRNKLVMHVRTHTGERPFRCEECGRGFARADGLVSHRKRHEVRVPPATTNGGAVRRRAPRADPAAGIPVLDLLSFTPAFAGDSLRALPKHAVEDTMQLTSPEARQHAVPTPPAYSVGLTAEGASIAHAADHKAGCDNEVPVIWMNNEQIRDFVASPAFADIVKSVNSASSSASDEFLTPASHYGMT
jgi:hypothetical protein